jgi:hypothetical protein
MRIFNQQNEEIKSYDEALGYLEHDRILVKHHDAIEGVEEQGHYEVARLYSNGGKDLRWVVDVEEVKAKEAYDEYEDILRYIAYSEEHLRQIKIDDLKQKLVDTDHMILKIIEGSSTLAECADIIAKRRAWRKEINDLGG